MDELSDHELIGRGYTATRRTDPRVAAMRPLETNLRIAYRRGLRFGQ
jgi:hypothetical protein